MMPVLVTIVLSAKGNQFCRDFHLRKTISFVVTSIFEKHKKLGARNAIYYHAIVFSKDRGHKSERLGDDSGCNRPQLIRRLQISRPGCPLNKNIVYWKRHLY